MSTSANKAPYVYRVTSFSDIIASPVFYSILFLAFVLGISSIFGFLQNPRKLKSVVDVIHQKVTVSGPTRTVNRNKYSLMQSNEKAENIPSETVTVSYLDENRYSIFSNDLSSNLNTEAMGVKKVSFDYDITSKQFWGALGAMKLDSGLKSENNSLNPLMLGIPMDDAFIQEQGDDKYSMKGSDKSYPISL